MRLTTTPKVVALAACKRFEVFVYGVQTADHEHVRIRIVSALNVIHILISNDSVVRSFGLCYVQLYST